MILRLNSAVRNKRASSVQESGASPGVKAVLALLRALEALADEVEPTAAEMGRFGNRAFRTWHARMVECAPALLAPVIETRHTAAAVAKEAVGKGEREGGKEGKGKGEGEGEGEGEATGGKDSPARADAHANGTEVAAFFSISDDDARAEIGAYLCASFGDASRIDYGSGHEAMFAVVLLCLQRVGVLHAGDDAATVLLVFRAYLRATRRLQTRYNLEPAGSHGVWGLDDYSFLPFLWGSSQLLASQRVSPSAVVGDGDAAMAELREEYLYVDAIAFIKQVKKGPFFEHSPMLFDISRVSEGWPKINRGMLRMYRAEVWEKRVVIQHFLFGSIFRFGRATVAPPAQPSPLSTQPPSARPPPPQ